MCLERVKNNIRASPEVGAPGPVVADRRGSVLASCGTCGGRFVQWMDAPYIRGQVETLCLSVTPHECNRWGVLPTVEARFGAERVVGSAADYPVRTGGRCSSAERSSGYSNDFE